MTDILDQLEAREAERQEAFRALLREAAFRREASPEEVEEVEQRLAETGRTRDDLRQFIGRVRGRARLVHEIMREADPAIERDRERVAELDRTMAEMEREFEARIGPMRREFHQLRDRVRSMERADAEARMVARRQLFADLPRDHMRRVHELSEAVGRAREAGDHAEVARLEQEVQALDAKRFDPMYIDFD